MIRRLIVRSEAEADITKAALWYDKREKGLGWDFTIEVRLAIQRAMELPLSVSDFLYRTQRRNYSICRPPWSSQWTEMD
jgi:hypothetical protein